MHRESYKTELFTNKTERIEFDDREFYATPGRFNLSLDLRAVARSVSERFLADRFVRKTNLASLAGSAGHC